MWKPAIGRNFTSLQQRSTVCQYRQYIELFELRKNHILEFEKWPFLTADLFTVRGKQPRKFIHGRKSVHKNSSTPTVLVWDSKMAGICCKGWIILENVNFIKKWTLGVFNVCLFSEWRQSANEISYNSNIHFPLLPIRHMGSPLPYVHFHFLSLNHPPLPASSSPPLPPPLFSTSWKVASTTHLLGHIC